MHPPILTKMGTLFLSWRRLKQQAIASSGVTLQQFCVLELLDKQAFLYPSHIAEAIYADRPTTTTILNNLEKNGWVLRKKDIENKKMVQVILTPLGKEKVAQVTHLLQQHSITPKATHCFDQQELAQLHGLLDKMEAHFIQMQWLHNHKEEI